MSASNGEDPSSNSETETINVNKLKTRARFKRLYKLIYCNFYLF